MEGGDFMQRFVLFSVLILTIATAVFSLVGCNMADPFQAQVPHPLNQFMTQKIYIIGASTVRYDNDMPGDIGANHSQYSTRMGWGSQLHNFLKTPQNVSNQARRGATAESYQLPHPEKGPAHWARTRQLIEDDGPCAGGYLLIQFGGNDNIQNVPEETFKDNLRFYRTQALALNLTPVFVTPVESRTTGPGGTRGEFPQYVRDVAAEDGRSLLLDLHAQSLAVFVEPTVKNLGYEYGNAPYIFLNNGSFSRIDNTHFEQRGAQIVAGWVRDLACELEAQTLSRLFDETIALNTPVIYSHAEYLDDPSDPDLNGWYVADALGNLDVEETNRIIEEVHDDVLESNVTVFTEHPDENFFVHGDWHDDTERSWANSTRTTIQWNSLFTSADFRIYIEVATTDGHRLFTYKPLDFDEGPGQNYPEYIRFGLGSDASDGTWKSFQRDLVADLNQFEPDNAIIQVNGFRMKGIGRIDNLRMF